MDLARRYSHLCHILSSQGLIVVIATISMFKEVHEWNRKNFHNYLEVYLDVPLHILRKRDPKGIYNRFDEGKIRHVAGLDMEIDKPMDADFFFGYKPGHSPDKLADILFNHIYVKKS